MKSRYRAFRLQPAGTALLSVQAEEQQRCSGYLPADAELLWEIEADSPEEAGDIHLSRLGLSGAGCRDMLELLEPFSRQMAEDLFSAFPDWERHLTIVADDGENFFNVQVPAPEGSKGGPLEVSSLYNQEMTVFYGSIHQHFCSVLGNADEPGGAIAVIKKLLNEQLVVVSYICTGDANIKDGVFSSNLVPPSEIPDANYEYYYTTTMRVRSWRGTFDADIAAPYVSSRPKN